MEPALIGNVGQTTDRAVTLSGTAVTSDSSADAPRSAGNELTSTATPPVARAPATIQPPAKILPETAGDVEPPPAPVSAHPIDGWLPIDLDAIERNARTLINGLDVLVGDESRGATVVGCAASVAGLWMAYEFASSRRQARLAAFANLPPEWLNDSLPEDTA